MNVCISKYENLHVKLTFQGLIILFSEWIYAGHNCYFIRFSMLENFASYIKNKSVNYDIILKELNTVQHYKSQG